MTSMDHPAEPSVIASDHQASIERLSSDRCVARGWSFGRKDPGFRFHSIRRRDRRGYALLIVMIVILASTALAAVHQRHLSAALRLEQARLRSESYAQGPLAVLAIAIDRLKTGDPPAPIAYRYLHSVAGATTLYRVEYQSAGTSWTVTADPDATATSLPLLPSSF